MAHPPKLELLKKQASSLGLSPDRVRQFGKLTRRKTWQDAIAFSLNTTPEGDRWKDETPVDNITHSNPNPQSLLTWIDYRQLTALFLVAVGFFAFVAPKLKTANLLPVKITIEIGEQP